MAIKINHLSYTYLKKTPNEVEALNDISLEIPEGKITTIIGHTGSGKSTLIQTLNGLLLPTSGTVEIGNFVVSSDKRKNKKIHELRKKVAIVFQFPEYQLFEETVIKDVAFGVKNFGASNEEAINKAKEALTSVGIGESYYEKSPFELSGGERRRVAIAGILAINPDILVLDEPTAGLDAKGTKDIMSLVQEMHKNGKTIILVTHDMNIVMQYCQKVIVLHNGSVLYDGTPNELFDSYTPDMAIEIPPLYRLGIALKEKGMKIDLKNIRNSDDLIAQIKTEKNHGK